MWGLKDFNSTTNNNSYSMKRLWLEGLDFINIGNLAEPQIFIPEIQASFSIKSFVV